MTIFLKKIYLQLKLICGILGEQKSWVVQLKDIEDNQIGEADYIYYKKDALKQVEDYKKKYGID